MSEEKKSRQLELLEMITKDVHTIKAITLFCFIGGLLIAILGFLASGSTGK